MTRKWTFARNVSLRNR